MSFVRRNIEALAPYVPGEQPGFRETGGLLDAGADPVLKLNTNENPYPPSPRVLEAIHRLIPEALRLYPPADSRLLRDAAAELHGLHADQVIATNGGDELLRLLLTVFCEPELFGSGTTATPAAVTSGASGGGGIGMTGPSYTLYQVLAAIQDTPVTVIDRPDADDGGFALPADYADQLNAAGCRLAFIVNPHAPSGRLETLDTLRKLADTFQGVLVIDEAYVDFAPAEAHAIPLLREGRKNVIILRSLSKGYSLAGLRVGYGLASASLIRSLHKARDSYNVDILAQTAATAALRDQAYARQTWAAVRNERTRLTAALRQRGFIVPESHSNFILATVPAANGGQDIAAGAAQAKALYEGLKARAILIRYFSSPRLSHRLRITLGSPAQNDRLLSTLDSLL